MRMADDDDVVWLWLVYGCTMYAVCGWEMAMDDDDEDNNDEKDYDDDDSGGCGHADEDDDGADYDGDR